MDLQIGKVLVKKIDVPSLRNRISKPDERWRISVKSFTNEFGFYSSADILALRDSGSYVPLPLSVDLKTDDSEFVSGLISCE